MQALSTTQILIAMLLKMSGHRKNSLQLLLLSVMRKCSSSGGVGSGANYGSVVG